MSTDTWNSQQAHEYCILFQKQTCFFFWYSLCQCSVLAVLLHKLDDAEWNRKFAAAGRQALLCLTLWLRSIGLLSALWSLCTTAEWRESIKTSQVHQTPSNPYPRWFHTHGSALLEHDYKMHRVPASKILSDLDFRAGEDHHTAHVRESVTAKSLKSLNLPSTFQSGVRMPSMSILLLWYHHNPIIKLLMDVSLSAE